MGRRKIKLELISNESVRKITFRKRKSGLLKKLAELATLCGVIACAVIFSAYDDKPDIWPSPEEASFVLEDFEQLPSKKQRKYRMGPDVFLETKISKLDQQLKKQKRKNQMLELELTLADYTISGTDPYDLCYIKNPYETIQLLKEFISSVTNKMEHAKNEGKD